MFYYFKNKQTLYLYLARYLQSFIEQNMKMEQLAGITDFSICWTTAWTKAGHSAQASLGAGILGADVLHRRAGNRPVLQKYQVRVLEELWDRYFTEVDLEKFRPGVQPRQVLDMLVYLTDGTSTAAAWSKSPWSWKSW